MLCMREHTKERNKNDAVWCEINTLTRRSDWCEQHTHYTVTYNFFLIKKYIKKALKEVVNWNRIDLITSFTFFASKIIKN